ncbi:fluoride efflux transporter FluC [Nocardia mangyaensis]|uniref:fluoride efflux transporter FluC n=1 Tax=Nocardia mangyaensis TaxID=2213200 RepID=UPI00267637E1|nr:CrcB family protein [Nocardia mangyaensis]MDO3646294.1 CrcB family protein [Nocardia mangyaensis]
MFGRHDPDAALPVDPDVGAPALRLRPSSIAAVALGGLLGTSARHGLGVALPETAGQWPFTTFAINVAGAFLLGGLLEALARSGQDSGWRLRVRLGVGTGVLGAFTTYSTLAVDTDLLLRADQRWTAIGYAFGSVAAGLVATVLGIAAGAWMTSRSAEQAT